MKRLLTVCLVFSVLLTSAQVTNQKLFDTIPFIPEHHTRRIALFEKEPVVTGKIIFLGNSITEGGEWTKTYR